MPIIDAYPILREFKADGDMVTVKSLKLWLDDFHIEPPHTAVNDNNPDVTPSIVETRIDAVRAERLIESLEEDEICKKDPTYKRTTPPYSAALHEERFERVKRTDKDHPPLDDVDAQAETIRYIDAIKIRDWLGADADVLDMATEPYTTFADIAAHIGAEHDWESEAKQEVKDVAATFYERVA